MADEKTNEKPIEKSAPKVESPKPSPSLAGRIAHRAPRPTALAKQGKHPAGLYEVTHGRLLLGYEHPRDVDGRENTNVRKEPVYADKGDRVQLTAEEAGALMEPESADLDSRHGIRANDGSGTIITDPAERSAEADRRRAAMRTVKLVSAAA